jgi:hypothetical protein
MGKTPVDSPRALSAAAIVVLCGLALLSGCGGDPTVDFQSFAARAAARLKADAELNQQYQFDAPKFDVRKTDSTVSPFVADLTISAVDTGKRNAQIEDDKKFKEMQEKLSDPEQRRLRAIIHDNQRDDGDTQFNFTYAYQKNAWVLQTSEAQCAGSIRAMIFKNNGPPAELLRHFTP